MTIPKLQDQIIELRTMIDVALPLADDIRKHIKRYPDASGTERSAGEIITGRLSEVLGQLQYLAVAFRPES